MFAFELKVVALSMIIFSFFPNSLVLYESLVERSRELFGKTNDWLVREALVATFNIQALFIVFLKLARSAVSPTGELKILQEIISSKNTGLVFGCEMLGSFDGVTGFRTTWG